MGSSAADDIQPLQEIMLEFRAGKMLIEGTRVVPDTRKGLVRIGRSGEGLLHFQWLDRAENLVEDDQIIFPDEAVFEKVAQASGRVYILKFESDNRKFFFWMQEPRSDGDAQICSSVNYYINRPLELVGEEETEASVPLQMSEMSDDMVADDISSRDGNLEDPNLVSNLESNVTSSSGPVQLADLQRILSSIGSAGAVGDQDTGLGLVDLLKPELLLPLLETLPLEQRLASYLPEGPWTPENLMELLQSPQFRQQVEAFTYVLRTGQIDLSQFGVDPSKFKFTVLSFLEALDESVEKTSDPDGTLPDSGSAPGGESREDENKDGPPQRCSGNDAMDEDQ